VSREVDRRTRHAVRVAGLVGLAGLTLVRCGGGDATSLDVRPGDVADEAGGDAADEAGPPPDGEDDAGEAFPDEGIGDDVGPDAACLFDLDCDDRHDCTADTCEAGLCRHVPDDAACDDGAPCNGVERCDARAGCLAGEPVVCDDRVDCTIDACDNLTAACRFDVDPRYCPPPTVCDPSAGCVEPPECETDADCLDTNPCNGIERCDPTGRCVFGTPPVCDDGIPCTIDACDPVSGCTARPPDRDGDGHPDAACSGDDCDDRNPAVHPGAPESCNGSDENCDTVPDDTFPCTPGQTGRCTSSGGCAGVWTCGADCAWGRCIVAAVESCNGADDDCDGLVDEDFTCELGSTGPCTVGACAGTRTCVAGCVWGACVASAVEACNGLDDDCDGATDEIFGCILGTRRSCTVGSCAGTQTCVAGCVWGACVASAVEACNGLDDDCDGATDEDFACRSGASEACTTTCGTAGSRTCSPACAWGACCAPAETCGNGCDDNCNGAIDEGCARRILVLRELCGGGVDHITPALTNLGLLASATVVGSDSDLSARLASGTWDLVVVDEYSNYLSSTTMDRLNGHVLAGGRLILSYWSLTDYASHALMTRAGVAVGSSYTAPLAIRRWVLSPLFTTPNALGDLTGFTDTCGIDGQYLTTTTAVAHAGYTVSPAGGQAALTVSADRRVILNAFTPQTVTQNADGDGKPDMVELYENEITHLLL